MPDLVLNVSPLRNAIETTKAATFTVLYVAKCMSVS
jgi:hypothetical protein